MVLSVEDAEDEHHGQNGDAAEHRTPRSSHSDHSRSPIGIHERQDTNVNELKNDPDHGTPQSPSQPTRLLFAGQENAAYVILTAVDRVDTAVPCPYSDPKWPEQGAAPTDRGHRIRPDCAIGVNYAEDLQGHDGQEEQQRYNCYVDRELLPKRRR